MNFERVPVEQLGERVTCTRSGVPFVMGLTRAEMGRLTRGIEEVFGRGAEVCLHQHGLSVACPSGKRVGLRVEP